MSYIASANIKMYPSSLRDDTIDRNAKLNSEQNLISIINRLSDKDGFIVSGFDVVDNEINPGICNIHGYYFEITQSITIPTGSSNVWFAIKLLEDANGFIQLIPYDSASATNLDTTSNFTGLNVLTEKPTGSNIYSLQIVSGGKKVDFSMLRFTTDIISYNNEKLTNSLENLPIDDGVWQ